MDQVNGGIELRDELKPLWSAISKAELPTDPDELFGASWNTAQQKFQIQEAALIDYKDKVPDKLSGSHGASIVRLCLGFHNTYGGIVVFGVVDGTFVPSGLSVALDIESFNRMLSDFTGVSIECLFRRYKMPGGHQEVGVLLVPKRGFAKPIKLLRVLGPYSAGTIWLRERHEVLEASPIHLPMIYSGRSSFASDDGVDQTLPIHRSLPPSPATMHSFIGRHDLMRELWDWFVFGDQPRMYLHGPGGSGKSTLAFEFAKTIADVGFNVVVPKGERIDYVLFLSAKETELNPLTGVQQSFTLRQFDDPVKEYKQILFHSGHFDAEAIESASEDHVEDMLSDLFSSYTGLLVLDDIDALSRRKIDTGEETLLLKAVGGTKRTRVLYTLRYPPSHARRNAIEVPGLVGKEFYDFLEACCRQFSVPSPSAEIIPLIEEETQSLPLLIETMVGLRRFCGNFQEALALFRDKGGDEARSYLYQREYDQLDPKGKSREVMATMLLIEEPVQFSTLVNLLSFSPQRVADALSECGSIFLSTSESATAETLYQLAPPSRPFIRTVSRQLDRFNQIERRVQLLRKEGSGHTPAEAALIVRMHRMLRQPDYEGVISLAESLSQNDPCLANPQIHALLGQAYSHSGADRREKARESFRHASALGVRDPAMMRAWYYLELRSGYGTEEAKRICGLMTDSAAVGPRYRSEFLSKLAWCYHQEAIALGSVSREKSIPAFQKSIETYLEAASLAQSVSGMEVSDTLTWLERPVAGLIRYLRDDLADYIVIFENLPAKKKDISVDTADILVGAITKAYLPNDSRVINRLSGLIRRAIGKLDRFVKDSPNYPGITHAMKSLASLNEQLIQ